MTNKLQKTQDWLDFINHPKPSLLKANVFDHHLEIENPNNVFVTPEYLKASGSSIKNSNGAPKNMYDGLQTAVNLCRVNAEYNPLDIKNNGDEKHFIKFTENIARMPFVTLLKSEVTEIEQSSKNADQLIDSFVNGFKGLSKKDKKAMINSVKNLVKAALSYSKKQETISNFSQNMLKDNDGKSVSFHLYNSKFTIYVTEKKGTIKFHAKYALSQAEYNMSLNTWKEVEPAFKKQLAVSTEEFLKLMTTPKDTESEVSVACLEETNA
jgi:hypothetical protein